MTDDKDLKGSYILRFVPQQHDYLSIEIRGVSDDSGLYEMIDLFESFLRAKGFSEESIKQVWGEL